MLLKTKIWNSEDTMDIFDYQNIGYNKSKLILKDNCDIFYDRNYQIKILNNETNDFEIKDHNYLISLIKKGQDYFLNQKDTYIMSKDKDNNNIYFTLCNFISKKRDNLYILNEGDIIRLGVMNFKIKKINKNSDIKRKNITELDLPIVKNNYIKNSQCKIFKNNDIKAKKEENFLSRLDENNEREYIQKDKNQKINNVSDNINIVGNYFENKEKENQNKKEE